MNEGNEHGSTGLSPAAIVSLALLGGGIAVFGGDLVARESRAREALLRIWNDPNVVQLRRRLTSSLGAELSEALRQAIAGPDHSGELEA